MEPILFSNEGNFTSLLQAAPIVAVDFFSSECPPCERFAPIFERLAWQYGMVSFVKVFRQGNRDIAEAYDVRSSPTVLFFHRGVLQEERFSGDIREEDVKMRIDALLRKEGVSAVETGQGRVFEEHDLCIVGTGPAGCTASVYAARYRVDHVLVGELTGGLMTASHKICNFPSETEISGIELGQKMADHVQHLGVPMIADTVTSVRKRDGAFDVILSGGRGIRARTVLLTTGTEHRHLGVDGEKRLLGRGVSYCATCDAAFFRGKRVAVVGGGDSANTAALYLADIADTVFQIHRGNDLKGEVAWIEQVKRHPKIKLIFGTKVVSLVGERMLESIELDHAVDGEARLPVDGLFIEIGSDPDGRLVEQLGVETDGAGFVRTGPDQRTSIPGVWAAGDMTTNSDGFRQIITACSEGAIAARSIFFALKTAPLSVS